MICTENREGASLVICHFFKNFVGGHKRAMLEFNRSLQTAIPESIVNSKSQQFAKLGNSGFFKIFQTARGMAIGHRLGLKSN